MLLLLTSHSHIAKPDSHLSASSVVNLKSNEREVRNAEKKRVEQIRWTSCQEHTYWMQKVHMQCAISSQRNAWNEKNRRKLASLPANDDNAHQVHASTITHSVTGSALGLTQTFFKFCEWPVKFGASHSQQANYLWIENPQSFLYFVAHFFLSKRSYIMLREKKQWEINN